MGIDTWFATYVYHEKLRRSGLTSLNKQLLKECYTIQATDTAGQRWSKKNYFNGYTSYGSVTDLFFRSPTFEELKKYLDKHVKKFANFLELDLQNKKLRMTSCWINIMGKNTHHGLHLHPLSTVSGTYYVSTPPGSGLFKVEDPRLSKFMAAPGKKENCHKRNRTFVAYEPQAGNVIMFESWLRHEVVSHQAKKERVSVSFNYDWY